MNESLTEDILINNFNKFANNFIIERKQAENPRIQKLLKNASKSGGGVKVFQIL